MELVPIFRYFLNVRFGLLLYLLDVYRACPHVVYQHTCLSCLPPTRKGKTLAAFLSTYSLRLSSAVTVELLPGQLVVRFDICRLPWITYPLIADRSRRQISRFFHHVRRQYALLLLILILPNLSAPPEHGKSLGAPLGLRSTYV